MAEKLGVDCKAFINTGTYGTPTWTEMTAVQEVTVSGTRTKAAFKSRGKDDVKYKVGLNDWSLSVVMLYNGQAADAQFILMRDAYTGKTDVDLYLLDGAVSATNQGLRSEFVLTGMSAPQPLEDGLTVTFDVAPSATTNDPTWTVEV